jgi:DNA replication and repair protein RecF
LHFTELRLSYFRCYAHLQLALYPGIHCFWGPNGVGKTNLLEAILLLATGRGLGADTNLVQHGEKAMAVRGQWLREGASMPTDLRVTWVPGEGKRVLENGNPVKLSAHYGRVPVVCLVPEDTDLITGPGATRRAWLDKLLAQSAQPYLQQLSRYDRALKQRNALLKFFDQQRIFDARQLEAIDQQLALAGAEILLRRAEFLEDFAPVFQAMYREVAQTEAPTIDYPTTEAAFGPEGFLAELARHQREDLRRCHTTWGPHRDELHFRLDGHAVRSFGSQGQRKTFAAALKLAEFMWLLARSGHRPLLLLDDVFDKLDATRVQHIAHLLDATGPAQVLVTDTDFHRLQRAFGHTTQLPTHFTQVLGKGQLAGG